MRKFGGCSVARTVRLVGSCWLSHRRDLWTRSTNVRMQQGRGRGVTQPPPRGTLKDMMVSAKQSRCTMPLRPLGRGSPAVLSSSIVKPPPPTTHRTLADLVGNADSSPLVTQEESVGPDGGADEQHEDNDEILDDAATDDRSTDNSSSPHRSIFERHLHTERSLFKAEVVKRLRSSNFAVLEHVDSICEKVQSCCHPLLIQGPAGSGKSSLIPLFLAEDFKRSMKASPHIFVIQPTRVASRSLASFLSGIFSTGIGSRFGFAISGEVAYNEKTEVVFCTPLYFLQRYHRCDVMPMTHLIVDEVHCRSVEMDLLIAWGRSQLGRQTTLRRWSSDSSSAVVSSWPFRLLYMSATIDVTELTAALCIPKRSVVAIDGNASSTSSSSTAGVIDDGCNTFPAELQHSRFPVTAWFSDCSPARLPQWLQRRIRKAFSEKCLAAVPMGGFSQEATHCIASLLLYLMETEVTPSAADVACTVLVFLPGIAEIMDVLQSMKHHVGSGFLVQKDPRSPIQLRLIGAMAEPEVDVLVLHSREIGEVAEHLATSKRPLRIVLATNVVENSVTIPNVRFVVDACFERVRVVDANTSAQRLATRLASRSNLLQRAGRTGRTCEGLVLRLIPRRVFDNLPQRHLAQIHDEAMDRLLLLGKIVLPSMSTTQLVQFLPEPPPPRLLSQAAVSLHSRLLLDGIGSNANLTALGHLVAQLPLRSELAFFVVMCLHIGVVLDGVIISALLEIPPLGSAAYYGASTASFAAMIHQQKLHSHGELSDVWAQRNIVVNWLKSDTRSPQEMAQYCDSYGLNLYSMKAFETRLLSIADALELYLRKHEQGPRWVDEMILLSCLTDRVLSKRTLHNTEPEGQSSARSPVDIFSQLGESRRGRVLTAFTAAFGGCIAIPNVKSDRFIESLLRVCNSSVLSDCCSALPDAVEVHSALVPCTVNMAPEAVDSSAAAREGELAQSPSPHLQSLQSASRRLVAQIGEVVEQASSKTCSGDGLSIADVFQPVTMNDVVACSAGTIAAALFLQFSSSEKNAAANDDQGCTADSFRPLRRSLDMMRAMNRHPLSFFKLNATAQLLAHMLRVKQNRRFDVSSAPPETTSTPAAAASSDSATRQTPDGKEPQSESVVSAPTPIKFAGNYVRVASTSSGVPPVLELADPSGATIFSVSLEQISSKGLHRLVPQELSAIQHSSEPPTHPPPPPSSLLDLASRISRFNRSHRRYSHFVHECRKKSCSIAVDRSDGEDTTEPEEASPATPSEAEEDKENPSPCTPLQQSPSRQSSSFVEFLPPVVHNRVNWAMFHRSVVELDENPCREAHQTPFHCPLCSFVTPNQAAFARHCAKQSHLLRLVYAANESVENVKMITSIAVGDAATSISSPVLVRSTEIRVPLVSFLWGLCASSSPNNSTFLRNCFAVCGKLTSRGPPMGSNKLGLGDGSSFFPLTPQLSTIGSLTATSMWIVTPAMVMPAIAGLCSALGSGNLSSPLYLLTNRSRTRIKAFLLVGHLCLPVTPQRSDPETLLNLQKVSSASRAMRDTAMLKNVGIRRVLSRLEKQLQPTQQQPSSHADTIKEEDDNWHYCKLAAFQCPHCSSQALPSDDGDETSRVEGCILVDVAQMIAMGRRRVSLSWMASSIVRRIIDVCKIPNCPTEESPSSTSEAANAAADDDTISAESTADSTDDIVDSAPIVAADRSRVQAARLLHHYLHRRGFLVGGLAEVALCIGCTLDSSSGSIVVVLPPVLPSFIVPLQLS